MRSDDVDVSRNDEAENLLACPQRTGFEDGRLRHFSIPGGEEHEEVHHFTLWWRMRRSLAQDTRKMTLYVYAFSI